MPFRSDRVQVKGRALKTDEGFIKADAVVTRAGVFRYLNRDGSERYELRPAVHVFDSASLDALTAETFSEKALICRKKISFFDLFMEYCRFRCSTHHK